MEENLFFCKSVLTILHMVMGSCNQVGGWVGRYVGRWVGR